jgi:hypothetical protein
MAVKRKKHARKDSGSIVIRTLPQKKQTIAAAAKRRGLTAAEWLVTLGLLEACDDMRIFQLTPQPQRRERHSPR